MDSTANAAVVLSEKLNTTEYNILPDNIINLYDYIDETGKVTEALVKEGIRVEQIMPRGEELESYFARVIGREQNV